VEGAPRFVADAMLGRLARWLRLCGLDVVYDPRLDDREIARIAAREGRTVLTRDAALLRRRLVRDGLFIEDQALGPQLRQVFAACGLAAERLVLFSRCVSCNGLLEEVAPAAVAGRAPPYVLRTQARFTRCPGCGRIYWAGTQVPAARARLAELLREEKADGAGGPGEGPGEQFRPPA